MVFFGGKWTTFWLKWTKNSPYRAEATPSETLFWGMVPLTHHEATERVVGEVGLIVVMGRMAFNGKKWGEDSGVMEAFRYLCG